MPANTVKPWTQIVHVRDDVRSGQLSLQEFAADLFDVMNRTGKRPLYEDPVKFFSLSYATSAQRDITAATAERLRGNSDKAIRQLELTYGGGKTHTLVTLTHLFRDPATLPDLPAVNEFKSAMGGSVPKARVGAVCFDKLDPEFGIAALSPAGEQRMLKHPWSVIAFQLAGADGLRALRGDGKDDERDTPPRDPPLEKLLEMPSKEGFATLILFDEVLMYAGEKAKDPVHGEQFREQFLNFLQSLTQAVAKVNTASLIVSLLASDPKRDDAFGRQLLSDMSNIMGRKEDEPFQPVGKDDVAEILRRRLLDPETTKDTEAFRPNVVAVVKALAGTDPEFAKTAKQRDDREKQYFGALSWLPSFPGLRRPVMQPAQMNRAMRHQPLNLLGKPLSVAMIGRCVESERVKVRFEHG
jgi:predicted AAA+ superfamily ATPase